MEEATAMISGVEIRQIEQIEKFLGVKIPDPSSFMGGLSIFSTMDIGSIKTLIFERPPFLCLNKAVVFGRQGSSCVITTSVVTKEACEGHFPKRPMIPLLLFSKAIALTGELLVAWVKKPASVVPLAKEAIRVKTKSRNLIEPPAVVLTEACLLRAKGQYCLVSARSWVGEENIASIKKLAYFVVSAEGFF
jgi:3-hydroxymyristoyl/3-hydroxydecanoyl-(acyl carrier protein) dehydratase